MPTSSGNPSTLRRFSNGLLQCAAGGVLVLRLVDDLTPVVGNAAAGNDDDVVVVAVVVGVHSSEVLYPLLVLTVSSAAFVESTASTSNAGIGVVSTVVEFEPASQSPG